MLKHEQTQNRSAFYTPTTIRGLIVAVGLVWYALLPAAQAQNSYTVTDLGTLGGNASEALGVNNRGEVIGDSRIPNSTLFHAFLYSGGQMQDLGTLWW